MITIPRPTTRKGPYHRGYNSALGCAIEKLKTGRDAPMVRIQCPVFRRGWQAACVDIVRLLKK